MREGKEVLAYLVGCFSVPHELNHDLVCLIIYDISIKGASGEVGLSALGRINWQSIGKQLSVHLNSK